MFVKQYSLMLSIYRLQIRNGTPYIHFRDIIDFEQQMLDSGRMARTSESLLNSLMRLETKQLIESHPNDSKSFRVTPLGRIKMLARRASR